MRAFKFLFNKPIVGNRLFWTDIRKGNGYLVHVLGILTTKILIDCTSFIELKVGHIVWFENCHVLLYASSEGFRQFMKTSATLGPIQPPIQKIPGALSLGVKWPRHEADRSPQSSAEVKSAWSYTSTPQYAFTSWAQLKRRDLCLYLTWTNCTSGLYPSDDGYSPKVQFVQY
jgi:hypothetical protein